MFALQRLGLHHLLNKFVNTESYCEFESYQYECGWRLGQWDMLTTENSSSSPEYEKHHYMCLKALHDLDIGRLLKEVTKARLCIVNSLINASLESSKNLYPALSQLQALQEIEDFASCNGNVEVVLEKWTRQSKLNQNDFLYIEPILTQRGILLGTALRYRNQFVTQYVTYFNIWRALSRNVSSLLTHDRLNFGLDFL